MHLIYEERLGGCDSVYRMSALRATGVDWQAYDLETKTEYLFRRLKERVGDQALTSILEHLYNLIILEKEPPSNIVKRLLSKRGRKSKVRKYFNAKSLRDALELLQEDFKQNRISKRTYYRAKRLLTIGSWDNTGNEPSSLKRFDTSVAPA